MPSSASTTAIIIPGNSSSQTISYAQLFTHVSQLQGDFARLGISPQAAVSIALPNSYEFVVAFLAATWQRAVAAPLNPAYRQEEFEFYLNDLKSIVLLLPKGAFEKKGPAVRAASRYGTAVAECFWDGTRFALEIKDHGKLAAGRPHAVECPLSKDIALVVSQFCPALPTGGELELFDSMTWENMSRICVSQPPTDDSLRITLTLKYSRSCTRAVQQGDQKQYV